MGAVLTNLSQAYEQGRKAYRRGQSSMAVPYAKKESADAWTCGWIYERELQKKLASQKHLGPKC